MNQLPFIIIKRLLAIWQQAEEIGPIHFSFYQKSKRRQSKGFRCERYKLHISSMLRSMASGQILAHAPYTINACGKDERVQEFARETMADDLRRLEEIPDCKYNFLYPGSHVQQGAEVGIEKDCRSLK